MKKYFALIALASLALAFTDCKKDDPVKVTGVSVNPTTLTLDASAKQTLAATVSPADADNKDVTWKSSSDAVATVSATGEVTAVGAGTATITVTTVAGAKTATCAVTVNSIDVAIAGDGFDIDKALEIKKSANLPTPTVPVKIDIEAPGGVTTFMVEVSSSSAAFSGALKAAGLDAAFDIANPGEALGAVLTGVGLINGDAVKGKTELSFDITGFIPMMFLVLEGDATADFKLTVIGAKGTKAEKTVKLSFVDDTAE